MIFARAAVAIVGVAVVVYMSDFLRSQVALSAVCALMQVLHT